MWVILGRTQCNFCDSAKSLLQGANKQYTYYTLNDPSSKWLLTLIKKAGYTTVPQIFDNHGNYIGGYTELKQHVEEIEHGKTDA